MNPLILTLDIDWAPDFMIEAVAEPLIARGIRATWFVTHQSPAVDRLRRHPELFELGLHPNFSADSTQGGTPEAVLRHCLALVPEAVSMRTHALMQSTALLDRALALTPVTTDVSLFLPHAPAVSPVTYWWRGRSLIRLPYVWEDDFEMERDAPGWHVDALASMGKGLKIFDFHPVHVYLNSAAMGPYESLKGRVRNLAETTPQHAAGLIHRGEGTRTLFDELVDRLAGGASLRIRDIAERWRASAGHEPVRAVAR